MASFASPRIRSDERYQGPIEPLSIWRGVGRDNKLNPNNELRILAAHPDGGWIYEWRARRNDPDARGQLGHAREESLRRIFRPVNPKPQEDTMADEAQGQQAARATTEELLGTTDPRRWAEAFVDTFPGAIAEHGVDEDTLIGWFSNAFQAKETAMEKAARENSDDAPEERPHRFSTDELHELVFLVGGAATGPCLKNAPDLVMPTGEVTEGINAVLADKGLPVAEYPPIIWSRSPFNGAQGWKAERNGLQAVGPSKGSAERMLLGMEDRRREPEASGDTAHADGSEGAAA